MSSAITVSGLRKTYGSFVAVDDVDLQVESGEVFAFLGPNGAGKTTTIDILTGIQTPGIRLQPCRHQPFSIFSISGGSVSQSHSLTHSPSFSTTRDVPISSDNSHNTSASFCHTTPTGCALMR